MATRTKEITFSGSAGRFDPSTYRLLKVTIEDPDINELLSGIHKEDIIYWIINEGFEPEDICDQSKLEKWAEANGYTKEND
jgi:hypothetical protein